MKSTHRLTLGALLLAVMLVLGYVESLIPLTGMPGVKVGLSNCVLMLSLDWLGGGMTLALLAGKVLAFLPAPAWDVRALSFVHHCIAAPVVEELVFRGAIQQLAQPLGRWQAAALQAVLFAVQHGTPAGMAWALGCGLVLGALRECTGRVWPGMLLHTLNNLLVFAAG